MVKISIVTSELSGNEKIISDLNKEVTALLNTDMNLAIVKLKRVWDLLEQSTSHHTVKEYLRLPNYLQQYGKMDEALLYFNQLIDETESRIDRHNPKLKKSMRNKMIKSDLNAIYNQMRIAYKRQGNKEMEKYYGQLADKYFK